MNLREWSRSVGLTRGDIPRIRLVRKASVPGRVVFLLPAAAAGLRRPRAMLAALEQRYPEAVAPVVAGEPIGTRFVRTVRRIFTRPELAALKAALHMERID